MIAIARESPSDDLCQDRSTTTYGTLVALKDYCCCTTSRNQTITITVERTACLYGVIIEGERLNTIE